MFRKEPLMKKFFSIILALITTLGFTGCRKTITREYSTAVTQATTVVETVTLPAFLTEESTEVMSTAQNENLTAKENTKAPPSKQKAAKAETTATTVAGSAETEAAEKSTLAERETVAKNVFDSLFESASVPVPGLTKAKEPSTAKEARDSSSFDDCAFVGNSRIMDFATYGLAKNVFADVSLTVDTVFTKVRSGKSVTIINELNGRRFSKIYLYFGDNECGWGSLPTFEEHYGRVVDAVRERCLSAEIYIMSIMPISRSADRANNYGYNMAALNRANEYVIDLARQKGVNYLNTRSAVSDAQGYLPEEASPDGVHLGRQYCVKWADYVYYNS